ncbi:uncharacterized protein LOC141638963 [Silene latifolia]|uniref:uncharacterized protein LOC141638963 n=1 Tax=Silene latifolia TaxID=37657 RepID=UPI003D77CEDC
MTLLSGLGVVLSLVFGCLLLALVAELYYLLWWKKQIITSSNSEDYSNHTKELLYLFCCSTNNNNNHPISNTITANPAVNLNNNPDLEMGLDSNKDLLWKALGEEGVESELMRLHNLGGPPRFLFTIKEETKEDLESEDGKSRCGGERSKSLGELIAALESHTPFLSPIASPLNSGLRSPFRSICLEGADSGYLQGNYNYNNPLFESSVEAEMFRLRSSPPPKFKFLRDAEEKLCRRLLEEAQKSGVLQKQKVILDNSVSHIEEEKDCSLIKCNDIHCSSQVLPLAASPVDQKKPSLL